MATEQGAGYAADSYARLRGIGALVTTFGVGELSALNAIAGAYAESVPVVHIVGTPALAARDAGVTLHHNLPGRDYGHFARMAAEITAAQADLRAGHRPGGDRPGAGRRAAHLAPGLPHYPRRRSRHTRARAARRLPQGAEEADPAVVAAFTGRARRLLAAASSASLLVGHLAARHRVTGQVRDLADRRRSCRWPCCPWPRATSPSPTRASPASTPARPRPSAPGWRWRTPTS